MERLSELSELVKTELRIKYNIQGVEYLEGYIERVKIEIPKKDWNGLINSCSSYLGECIIENYGGKWKEEIDGQFSICFNEENKVFPFAKTSKQFNNGIEDSILSFYKSIPIMFKITQKKKKWWKL